MTSYPCYRLRYRDPCDCWRDGPAYWTEGEARQAAAELRRIHPQTETRVEQHWTRTVD